jgi:hypothetical protein
MMRTIILFALAFSIAGATAVSAQSTSSFFQTEIAPILEEKCAVCHLTGQEPGKMSLVPDNAIGSLVGIDAVGAHGLKRVVPGDPDASYLVRKLEGTQGQVGGIGGQMPFGGPPLSADEIGKVRRWIADGAKP